jgi:plasmid maintenance system antidote protein VapI
VIIIENAGMVSKETMKSLLELSNLYQNNIAIILEDTREKINHLLRGNSQLNSIFNNRVHLHKYTLEDYMGFAYDYITEHDYEIEMEAFIALQNEFSVFMHEKRENALQAIFSYLDGIIQKSEKRSTEQLKEVSQSGRFDDTELMVVKREDVKS